MIDYISKLPPLQYATATHRVVSVMGSTGSIGRSALSVMAETPGYFKVLALAGGENLTLLAEQAAFWRPAFLAVLREEWRSALADLLPQGYRPEILAGPQGYAALASLEQADTVISAQVGAAGLAATAAAAAAGKVIALANKESLVLAGPLLKNLCRQSGACILPVDSEHNAIFQCLLSSLYAVKLPHDAGKHGPPSAVKRLILTASGGPFRGKDAAFLQGVTKAQALNHPNWKMGPKISVDSATLMNKGLEVIEACRLYGLPQEEVAVLVHPQSVVHSMVEFADNSILAQLGPPDMRVPLAHVLGWPQRITSGVTPLDLLTAGPLSFEEPDSATFPCLELCREALRRGGGSAIALNAANEVAVELFLEERLSFTGIHRLVEAALNRHAAQSYSAEPESLEEIMELDALVRRGAYADAH